MEDEVTPEVSLEYSLLPAWEIPKNKRKQIFALFDVTDNSCDKKTAQNFDEIKSTLGFGDRLSVLIFFHYLISCLEIRDRTFQSKKISSYFYDFFSKWEMIKRFWPSLFTKNREMIDSFKSSTEEVDDDDDDDDDKQDDTEDKDVNEDDADEEEEEEDEDEDEDEGEDEEDDD